MTITLSRSTRHRAALVGLILAMALASAVTVAPASAVAADRLLPGQQIGVWQNLTSTSGRSYLSVATGYMPNIAVWRTDCAAPRWWQHKTNNAPATSVP